MSGSLVPLIIEEIGGGCRLSRFVAIQPVLRERITVGHPSATAQQKFEEVIQLGSCHRSCGNLEAIQPVPDERRQDQLMEQSRAKDHGNIVGVTQLVFRPEVFLVWR